MVGRDLVGTHRVPLEHNGTRSVPTPILEVQGLSDKPDARSGPALLRDISFHVRAGEVVVLAGLCGGGRTETALSIFGARPFGAGRILIDGHPQRIRQVSEAIAAGIGYLPEDRKQAGLFLEMSIAHNVAAASLAQFGKFVTNDSAIHSAAEEYRQRLKISCRSIHQSVKSLSGGNQQKVLLAKWLQVEPRVLIVDEPTRGVDVGGKAEVHQLLVELAERGTAVLVISSDLPEVLALGDRVLVMAQGRLAGELSRADASEERVMHLAAGTAR